MILVKPVYWLLGLFDVPPVSRERIVFAFLAFSTALLAFFAAIVWWAALN